MIRTVNTSVQPSMAQWTCGLCAQALIDGRVLCVHGGLSPDLRTLDQVRSVVTIL